MSEEVWRRDEPDSPCIQVCVIHPRAGICAGCYRTAGEIAAWPNLSREERRKLMSELPMREDLLKSRTGRRRRS